MFAITSVYLTFYIYNTTNKKTFTFIAKFMASGEEDKINIE